MLYTSFFLSGNTKGLFPLGIRKLFLCVHCVHVCVRIYIKLHEHRGFYPNHVQIPGTTRLALDIAVSIHFYTAE